MEAELREQIRSKNHGMGSFADSLMRDLRVLEYNEGGGESDNNNNSSNNISMVEGLSSLSPSLVVSFPVSKDLCNSFETLHGGAQATAVDIFTSMLLWRVQGLSVTADLHVSYMSAAPLGSTIVCVCKADRYGGALQYSSCDLYREILPPNNNNNNTNTDNRHPVPQREMVLVAKGLHTKYVLKKRKKRFDGGIRRSKL